MLGSGLLPWAGIAAISGQVSDKGKRSATYENLCAVPDHLLAQIVDGELIVQPRPGLAHVRATSRLGTDIGGPFDRGRGGPGGWVILYKPEAHFDKDVLVPDLAGWRRERLPEIPDAPSMTLPPDWVCEVLSPSSQSIDRVRKMNIYGRHRVSHAWLVDPAAQTLEVYRLDGENWLRVGSWAGDQRVRAEPFDSIELELDGLWAR